MEQARSCISEIVDRLDALLNSAVLSPAMPKAQLLASRQSLFDAMFSRPLTPAESTELQLVESQLEEMEVVEADESDVRYAGSRVGKIEAALDRLEASIVAERKIRYKTA